jgi:hypothetical protein
MINSFIGLTEVEALDVCRAKKINCSFTKEEDLDYKLSLTFKTSDLSIDMIIKNNKVISYNPKSLVII